MATFYTTAYTAINADSANTRTALTQIKTTLTSANWVQTADTGQLDQTTLTWTSTASAVYGYWIFYLNDSLHATYPLYMKVYFWNSGTSAIEMLASFGFATDGAGNFTGNKYPAAGNGIHAGGGGYSTFAFGRGTTYPVAACGGDGFSFINHMMVAASVSEGFLFGVCREFNPSTGAPTGGNFTVYVKDSGTTYSVINYNRSLNTAWYVAGGMGVAFNPYERTISQSAATTDLIRHYAAMPTSSTTPNFIVIPSILGYNTAEIAYNTTFTAQPLAGGSPRTYYTSQIVRSSFSNATTNYALAFIWE
jgi:hypothetical protein